MRGRKSNRPDYTAKLAELAEKTEHAVEVQGIVESREPFFERLGAELRTMRMENHFTPLFIAKIGPRL